MSIKVSTISAFINGGAGKAAFRLHKGLMKQTGIEASLIHQEKVDEGLRTQYNLTQISREKISLKERVLLKGGIDIRTKTKNARITAGKPSEYEVISFSQTIYRPENDPHVKEADILHLHWVAGFLNYPTFFKSVHQPIVWTLHDMNPFMGLFHYEGDLERNRSVFNKSETQSISIKKAAINNADLHIVCLSDWLMEKSQKSELLGRFPHYLIPNGINIESIKSYDNKFARQHVRIENDHPTLLFVAQDIKNYRKGFDILYNSLLNYTEAQINIIAVGGAIAGLPENISVFHFENIRDEAELNLLYTAADLFVLPSREDNLPNVMLESFANGTPVLSFNTGGMKDWIVNDQNGILVEMQGGSASLLDGIKYFIANQSNFNRQDIRQFCKINFNDHLQSDRHVKLYQSILKK